MIKIKNVRQNGYMFHYAHFICDCLFPEVISNIFNYKEVVREKNMHYIKNILIIFFKLKSQYILFLQNIKTHKVFSESVFGHL